MFLEYASDLGQFLKKEKNKKDKKIKRKKLKRV